MMESLAVMPLLLLSLAAAQEPQDGAGQHSNAPTMDQMQQQLQRMHDATDASKTTRTRA